MHRWSLHCGLFLFFSVLLLLRMELSSIKAAHGLCASQLVAGVGFHLHHGDCPGYCVELHGVQFLSTSGDERS